MQVVGTWLLLALAGLVVLIGFFFAGRGLLPQRLADNAFNVARQEALLARRNNLLRGILIILLGAFLLVATTVWGDFRMAAEQESPAPTVTAPAGTATAAPLVTATATLVVPQTPAAPTAAPTMSPVPPSPPSPTPPLAATTTPTPSETPTTSPQTAVVASGVGVWLRAAPGTTSAQLAWLLDGTELILLDQVAEADQFSWQFVRAPDGREGWVAVDFLQTGP